MRKHVTGLVHAYTVSQLVAIESQMVVKLTATGEDGAKTEVEIKEGDTLTNLVVDVIGAEHETIASAEVVKINFMVLDIKEEDETVPVFNRSVRPTTMLIDDGVSEELREIAFVDIVGFDGTAVEDPDDPDEPVTVDTVVSNLQIGETTVYFDSAVELSKVIWNEEEIVPTLISGPAKLRARMARAAVYKYKFVPTTIGETNTLVVVDAAGETIEGTSEIAKEEAHVDLPYIMTNELGTWLVANGVPVVLSAGENGKNICTWDGDSIEFAQDCHVIGGAYGKDVDTTDITVNGGTYTKNIYGAGFNGGATTTNIVVNDGTMYNVIGGGAVASVVDTSNVTINGGTIAGVQGGGFAYFDKSNNITKTIDQLDEGDAPNLVKVANVEIKGGTFKDATNGWATVYGGGQGYARVDEANTTITGGTFTDTVYVSVGGSNGLTRVGNMTISGGVPIWLLQTINRGRMWNANLTINDAVVDKLYCGGEEDSSVSGEFSGTGATTPNIKVDINGGTITTLRPGYDNKALIPTDSEKLSCTVAAAATVSNLEDVKALFGTCLVQD